MSDNTNPSLGDHFCPGGSRKSAPNELRMISEDEAERLIVGAAVALGKEPQAVLDDFRRDGALADLVRTFLRVETREDDSFWQAIDALKALRADGFKGAELRRLAAERLNRPDALGRARRNVSPDSLKTYEAEAKRLRKASTLTALFMPDDWRPTRAKPKVISRKR